MHRTSSTLALTAALLACDAAPAADTAGPTTTPSLADDLAPPRPAPELPPLPRVVLRRPPVLPPADGTGGCEGAAPAHTLAAIADSIDLDGAHHPDAAAAGTTLAALARRSSPLELALAFDHRSTLAQLRPLLAALGRLDPPPRLYVSLGTDAKHVPIAGIDVAASDKPTATPPPAAYLLRLDGEQASLYDLAEPTLELQPNASIAGASLLVTATESTPWRAIAGGLTRACGDARLVETTHPLAARVPTATRPEPGKLPPSATSLDPDLVRRIIHAHGDETRRCYDEARERDPAVKGTLALRFRVGKAGKVTAAAVAESTVTDKAVGACLVAAVRRWRFPVPKGGRFETVYPFVLEFGASDPR